jgi:hypothetical protein
MLGSNSETRQRFCDDLGSYRVIVITASVKDDERGG